MNEHDFLDAIGGIDPKFIDAAGDAEVLAEIEVENTGAENADRVNHKKRARIVHFQRYVLAAAGLILLVVSGIVFRNSLKIEEYVDEMAIEENEVIEGDDIAETYQVPENGTDQLMVASEAPEAEESTSDDNPMTESANAGDYPMMLMVDGDLYIGLDSYTGEGIFDEAEIHPVLSYVDGEPSENGAQNFDRSLTSVYRRLDENALAVLIDGKWQVFQKKITE